MTAQILSRIAEIEREILSPDTGKVCIAYDNIPGTLTASQMPCFVNYPRQLIKNDLVGSDERGRTFLETRNFGLTLYHSPVGTGANEEKTGLLVPYFELVYSKFGSYPHLKALEGIVDALITNDSGTGTATYSGTEYYAINFNLQVIRRVRRLLDEID